MRWYNHEHRHSRIRFVRRPSAIAARIIRCWRVGMRCINKPALVTRDVGQVTRATGSPIGAVASTRNGNSPRWKRRHKNTVDATRPVLVSRSV